MNHQPGTVRAPSAPAREHRGPVDGRPLSGALETRRPPLRRAAVIWRRLQAEKTRLILTCIWIGAAVAVGLTAVLFVGRTLDNFGWGNAWLAAYVGLALGFTCALFVIIRFFRRFIACRPALVRRTAPTTSHL
ncbi:MAG: hypothetical protein ABII82_11215 [Verrucomicrobiota bacterium]